jgi:hypothetical protein
MPINSIERLRADNYLLLKHKEHLVENRREELDAQSASASTAERLEAENRVLTEQVEHLRGLRARHDDVDELCDAVIRSLPRVA